MVRDDEVRPSTGSALRRLIDALAMHTRATPRVIRLEPWTFRLAARAARDKLGAGPLGQDPRSAPVGEVQSPDERRSGGLARTPSPQPDSEIEQCAGVLEPGRRPVEDLDRILEPGELLGPRVERAAHR